MDFALISRVWWPSSATPTTNIGSVLNSTGCTPSARSGMTEAGCSRTGAEEDAALLGQTVTALNGVPMDEICTRFGTLVSADNPVKSPPDRAALYSEACLDYLGIAESGEPLEVTTSGSFTVGPAHGGLRDAALSSLSQQRESTPATAYRKGTYYFAQSWMTPPITFNLTSAWRTQAAHGRLCRPGGGRAGGGRLQVLPLDLTTTAAAPACSPHPYAGARPGGGGREGLRSVGEATYSSAIINAVELVDAGGVLAGSPPPAAASTTSAPPAPSPCPTPASGELLQQIHRPGHCWAKRRPGPGGPHGPGGADLWTTIWPGGTPW